MAGAQSRENRGVHAAGPKRSQILSLQASNHTGLRHQSGRSGMPCNLEPWITAVSNELSRPCSSTLRWYGRRCESVQVTVRVPAIARDADAPRAICREPLALLERVDPICWAVTVPLKEKSSAPSRAK